MRVRSFGGLVHSGSLLVSIAAILVLGPGCDGSSPTTPTPPPATCTYQLTAITTSLGPDASSTTITVTTGASCSWTATVEGDWLSIASGGNGTGPGAVTVNAAANANEAAREGVVRVAGESVRLTQQGRASGSCETRLEPEWLEIGKEGGSRTVNLTTGAGCPWTLAVTESWLTVSPMSGAGSATLSLQVPAYTGIPERRADIQVNGDSLRVDQGGDLSACSYAVVPTEVTLHWHHTAGQITLTAQNGCPWTARSGGAWLDVPIDEGDGDATIQYRMNEFFQDGVRKAPVEIRWPTPTAGQNVWVTQEGCRYGLGPSKSVTFPAAGGTADAVVIQQPVSPSCNIGCSWTVQTTVSWIVLSKTSGAGDDKFTYQVLANTSGALRVGTIRVMTEVMTITQNP